MLAKGAQLHPRHVSSVSEPGRDAAFPRAVASHRQPFAKGSAPPLSFLAGSAGGAIEVSRHAAKQSAGIRNENGKVPEGRLNLAVPPVRISRTQSRSWKAKTAAGMLSRRPSYSETCGPAVLGPVLALLQIRAAERIYEAEIRRVLFFYKIRRTVLEDRLLPIVISIFSADQQSAREVVRVGSGELLSKPGGTQ